MLELNKIYCGDCLEVMKEIPDKSIDLVLTDFPYGINCEYDGYEDTQENLKYLVDNAMPEILRISKRALITCGVLNIQLYPKYDWSLCWVSSAGAGSGPWGFCCWQPILAYGKDPYLQNGKGRRPDIIESNEQSNKNLKHSCPKPLNFWKKLLLRGSVFEGDVVCDPMNGSGTTTEVCKILNRKFVGIDQSQKYCDIAEKRLQQETIFN